jgi:hypothetical protein
VDDSKWQWKVKVRGWGCNRSQQGWRCLEKPEKITLEKSKVITLRRKFFKTR